MTTLMGALRERTPTLMLARTVDSPCLLPSPGIVFDWRPVRIEVVWYTFHQRYGQLHELTACQARVARRPNG